MIFALMGCTVAISPDIPETVFKELNEFATKSVEFTADKINWYATRQDSNDKSFMANKYIYWFYRAVSICTH